MSFSITLLSQFFSRVRHVVTITVVRATTRNRRISTDIVVARVEGARITVVTVHDGGAAPGCEHILAGAIVAGVHGAGDAVVAFRICAAAIRDGHVLTARVRVADIEGAAHIIIAVRVLSTATLDGGVEARPVDAAVADTGLAGIAIRTAITAVRVAARWELALVVDAEIVRARIRVIALIVPRATVCDRGRRAGVIRTGLRAAWVAVVAIGGLIAAIGDRRVGAAAADAEVLRAGVAIVTIGVRLTAIRVRRRDT